MEEKDSEKKIIEGEYDTLIGEARIISVQMLSPILTKDKKAELEERHKDLLARAKKKPNEIRGINNQPPLP